MDELRLELHGTKGSLKWNLEELNYYYYYNKEEDFSGYKKISCFTNLSNSSDFPPPKVTAGWLTAHIHCLYHFVKEISDSDYKNKNIAKFKDGHSVQLVLDSIN